MSTTYIPSSLTTVLDISNKFKKGGVNMSNFYWSGDHTNSEQSITQNKYNIL